MYSYHVPDMTCFHCERAIRNEIEEVDAAAVVEVNIEAKEVRVESQLSENAIQAAIAEVGFQVFAQA